MRHVIDIRFRPAAARRLRERRGSVIVLAAAMLIVIFAFTSFTIDLGFIALTKAELQNATDSAALAAAQELEDGLGNTPVNTPDLTSLHARTTAQTLAGLNPAGEYNGVYIDSSQDVRLGQLQWNEATETWDKVWGATPYTMVEVSAYRGRSQGGTGSSGQLGQNVYSGSISGDTVTVNLPTQDNPLPLFFAPIIGHDEASLSTTSVAGVFAGGGFRIDENSSASADILPIAMDEQTWNDLMAGIGNDNYGYDDETGTVTNQGDGILEANLYPSGSSSLPPGNRGTVDIGSPNNSTADLKRQITDGVNAEDLSWFGGELRFDSVPLELNGDTGLSAGIGSSLKQIIGQPRAIPIFSTVSGPGNNAMYTIVKFVGIRVLDVNLRGKPQNKRVVIQPAPFSDSTVIRSTSTIQVDSILTMPALIQ